MKCLIGSLAFRDFHLNSALADKEKNRREFYRRIRLNENFHRRNRVDRRVVDFDSLRAYFFQEDRSKLAEISAVEYFRQHFFGDKYVLLRRDSFDFG